MAEKTAMRSDVKEMASRVLERAESSSWNQTLHVILVGSLVCKVLGIKPTPEQSAALKDVLAHKGVAGNASQFSQALAEEGVIDAKPRAKVIAAEFISE